MNSHFIVALTAFVMLKIFHNFLFLSEIKPCPRKRNMQKSLELFSSQITIVCVRHLWWCIAFAIHKIKSDVRTNATICSQSYFSFSLLSWFLYFILSIYMVSVAPCTVLSEHQTSTRHRQLEKEKERNNGMRMCERDKRETTQLRQPHNSTSAKLIHRVTWMRRFIAIYTVVSHRVLFSWFDA